jgi:cell division protein FtsB
MLDAQAQADALRQYAQELEQEKQLLQDKIDKLGTEDSVGDIAKDELDLVDKDTIIIKPEG